MGRHGRVSPKRSPAKGRGVERRRREESETRPHAPLVRRRGRARRWRRRRAAPRASPGRNPRAARSPEPAAPPCRSEAGCSGSSSVSRARSSSIGRGIADIFTKRKLDAASLDDLEDVLIQADLGLGAATRIRQAIAARALRKGHRPGRGQGGPRRRGREDARPCRPPARLDPTKKPFVVLVVGVNGSGKTTTIGKLAAKFRAEGHDRHARGRRHVPRRGDRAAAGLGAPHRLRPRGARPGRATPRASPSTR